MRNLLILIAILSAGIAVAQVVPQPGPPTPIACAFNSAPVTLTNGQAGWIQCGSNGAVLVTASGTTQVVGNVANGAVDSGNPVKVGGIAHSGPPAVDVGDRVDGWYGVNGGAVVAGPGLTGVDGQSNNMVGLPSTASAVARLLGVGPSVFNGASWDRQRGDTRATYVANAGSVAAGVAITSAVTGAAANNVVIKASAGNLYSVFAANHTATAGFLVIVDATSAPVDGAITPLECAAIPANGNATITYQGGPPARFATGITAVLTSAANCFTKTTGVITGFIRGSAL